MNNLKIFENKEFGEIRTVIKDGEPWFVGRDVALALGYAKPENAVMVHIDAEDKSTINIGTVKPLFEILYSRLSSVYTKAETDDHIKNAVDKETQARTSAIDGVKSDISSLSKKDTELSQGIDDNKNKLNAVNADIESVNASVKNLSDKHTNDINNVNKSINTVVADVLKLQNVDNKYSAEFTNIAGVMSLPLLPDETKVSTIADVRKVLDPLVASLHDGFINLAKIKIESGGSIINPGGGMIGS